MTERTITLPGEQIAAHAQAIPAESPAPSPCETIPEPANDFGSDHKKGAARRIKELDRRNKNLQRQNEALHAEADHLRTAGLAAIQEGDVLREQLRVAKGNIETLKGRLQEAEAQAQAQEARAKQTQADAESRRHEAWKALIARSRPLAATSNFDEAMGKSDRFFSTALLEQILQFQLGPEIVHRLALKPELCQELSKSSLSASALALVRIESELQQEIAKKNAEQAFVSAANRGGW